MTAAPQLANHLFPLKSVEANAVAVFEGEAYYSEPKRGWWQVATPSDIKALTRGDRVSECQGNWVYTFLKFEGSDAVVRFVGYNFTTRIPLEKLQIPKAQGLTSSNSFQVGDRINHQQMGTGKVALVWVHAPLNQKSQERITVDFDSGKHGVVFAVIDDTISPLEQSCSTPSDFLKESADLPEQPNFSAVSDTGNLLKSTPSVSEFSSKTFPECLSGQISEIITPTPENLISSQAGSPVRISPSPIIRGEDCQESDRDSGLKCSELSERLNPDLSLSKTSPQLLTGIGLEPSWKDWMKAGSMLSGKLYQQQAWERPTCESVSLLLPTPTASDSKDRKRSKSAQGGMSLSEALKLRLLPTPLSSDRGSVREDFSPTLNLVLKQPNQVCNPEVWEWMMGFPTGWTELPTADGGQKTPLPEMQESSLVPSPIEESESKRVGTQLHPNKLQFRSEEFCSLHKAHTTASPNSAPPIPQATAAEILHDSIAQLEQERDRILSEGELSPEGAWIETGKVKGRDFRQAWWRATKPIFSPKRSRGNAEAKVKSSYIGEEGSEAHKGAIAAHQRRKAYKRVCRQIELLEKEID